LISENDLFGFDKSKLIADFSEIGRPTTAGAIRKSTLNTNGRLGYLGIAVLTFDMRHTGQILPADLFRAME